MSSEDKPAAGNKADRRDMPTLGARLRKGALMGVGFLSTGVGILGIFLPLVPTVPLLLLAAACFARSSKRCHGWLVEHERLGPLIRGYLDGSGVPRRTKIIAVVMIWATITPSALLFVPLVMVRGLLFMIAISVSLYIFHLPTRK
jgi:uncharacterized protein